MSEPALVLTGITKRFARGPERHGVSWKLKQLAHVAARRVELPYFLVSIAGAFGPIAAASMFHDGCRPPFIDGRYRMECTFERLILAPKQRFTVRFALYAADATTILHPKQAIATFVMGGSGTGCGFFHELAEGRILGGPPVLADYTWRMPGGIEKAWTSDAMALETHHASGG